jgi:hypothetical protein
VLSRFSRRATWPTSSCAGSAPRSRQYSTKYATSAYTFAAVTGAKTFGSRVGAGVDGRLFA